MQAQFDSKKRVRAPVPNPFNALSLHAKSKDKRTACQQEQLWAPQMQVGKRMATIPVSPRSLAPLLVLMRIRRTCRIPLMLRPRPRLHLFLSKFLARLSLHPAFHHYMTPDGFESGPSGAPSPKKRNPRCKVWPLDSLLASASRPVRSYPPYSVLLPTGTNAAVGLSNPQQGSKLPADSAYETFAQG
jgi:hypothetical protein